MRQTQHQRFHPPKIAPEWLVYRKENGSLWYFSDQGTWTVTRLYAKGFPSPAEAQVVATEHAATVARK